MIHHACKAAPLTDRHHMHAAPDRPRIYKCTSSTFCKETAFWKLGRDIMAICHF